jgi:parallel beta-helix repeat protein
VLGFALVFSAVLLALTFSSNIVRAQNGLDFILITESPGGKEIGNMTYSLGENDTFYCSGYNNSQGFIGLEWCYWQNRNWGVGEIYPIDGFSTNFSAIGVGTTWVDAYFTDPTGNGSHDATGDLTVLPSGVDGIVIISYDDGTGGGDGEWVGDRTYHVGEIDWFHAMALNDTHGEIGMVPVNWSSNNTTVCNVTKYGTTSTFEALNKGTCKVEADYEGIHTNSTGTLTIIAGLDYILITDSPNGTEVGNMTYYLGENDTFYCSGYNSTEGFLGLEDCHWYSEDWKVGIVVPEYGTNVTFNTTGLGSTWVQAFTYDPGQMNYVDTTGELKVVPKNVQSIAVVDSPNPTGPNAGKWVGDRQYLVGDTDTFWAMAYNDTLVALGVVSANWTSSNDTVCSVTTPGTSTSFKALREGTCNVTAEFQGVYTNTTGTFTVTKPGIITVDDDGPADYKTIQEAIDAANPGDKIFVYAGTYPENVDVYKRVTLEGEDTDLVVVTGGGAGTVFHVTADGVSISYFTITEGEYGIFSDNTDGLIVDHNIITDYTYGIYQNRTTDSWITYNDISYGEYGIVTFEAHNDAIRYNTLSYNSVYGAKDYNSQLKNCFNWNKFYKNKVAYYYDPDQELSTLEFDGNIIEDNEIGIKVAGASTVDLTNNTIKNNDYGIYITTASPLVFNNTLIDNRIGIYCKDSSSLFLKNVIVGSQYGIYCEEASPEIVENSIEDSEDYAIYLVDSESVKIVDNDVDGGNIWLEDSQIDSASLLSSEVESISSTIDDMDLDSSSQITVLWRLKVQVLDEDNNPVRGAVVWVNDTFGSSVGLVQTGSDGWSKPLLVTQKVDTKGDSESYNPHLITAIKDEAVGSLEETVVGDKELVVVIVRPPPGVEGFWFPLELLVVLGSVIAIGAGLAAFLSTEVGKFALLALIVPLYMKLRKSRILDHYDRGRVFQYIELNPGEHYNQIKRDMGLPNGSLVHHLTVLEKGGKIKSRKDGRFRRFYTKETQVPRYDGGVLTEVQKRIVDAVKDIPGVTQKEVASLLGVHQSSVSYQMSRLEERGLIKVEKKGRKVHYYYVGKR